MAGLNVSISTNVSEAGRWAGAITKQFNYAASVALNNTAFDARASINGATRQYLDKPVTFTQNAYLVAKATKTNLDAVVYPEALRRRYLRFSVHGGTRPQKGFERRFLGQLVASRGVPADSQLMPTPLVKLTASGNVSLATIRSIESGLSTTNAKGGFFFGIPRGGDRPPGIYRRSKQQLFPYFIATTDAGSYRAQFPIEDIAGKVVRRRYSDYFQTALERAIATAR